MSAESDEERLLNFLVALYPNGASYTQMLENAKRSYLKGSGDPSTSVPKEVLDRCEARLKELLEDQQSTQQTIYFYNQKVKGGYESIIKLTKNGVGLVWGHVEELYQKNPLQVLSLVKKWVKMGDQTSLDVYYRLLHAEIDQHFDVYSAMVLPHTIVEIIQHTAFLLKVDMDNDKEMEKTQQAVIDLVNRGLLVGLIQKDSRTFDVIDKGKPSKQTEEYYQLTDDGRNGLYNLNNQIREGTSFAEKPTSAPPQGAREILKDYADLPWKKIFVWWVINVLISVFLFNIVMTNTLDPTFFWVWSQGIFLFLISISETVHQIKDHREKKAEKTKRMKI